MEMAGIHGTRVTNIFHLISSSMEIARLHGTRATNIFDAISSSMEIARLHGNRVTHIDAKMEPNASSIQIGFVVPYKSRFPWNLKTNYIL